MPWQFILLKIFKSHGTLTARFGVEIGCFDVNTHKGYSPKTIKNVKGGGGGGGRTSLPFHPSVNSDTHLSHDFIESL